MQENAGRMQDDESDPKASAPECFCQILAG